MRQLIAGLALTPASVFAAVVPDSCSESLYTKQPGSGVSSLVAEWPGGYRDDTGLKFSQPQCCF